MTIIKLAFRAIQTKLATDYAAARIIDLWNDQINQYRAEELTILPAVFVEFMPIAWRNIGRIKHGTTTLRIHIAQNIIGDTKAIDGVSLPSAAAALQRFDNVQIVLDSLEGYRSECFNALELAGTTIDASHDGIVIDVLEYAITLTDGKAMTNTPYNQTIPLPDVAVEQGDLPPGAVIANGVLLPPGI
jgi:hypothetical protein